MSCNWSDWTRLHYPILQVLNSCASSTVARMRASRWIFSRPCPAKEQLILLLAAFIVFLDAFIRNSDFILSRAERVFRAPHPLVKTNSNIFAEHGHIVYYRTLIWPCSNQLDWSCFMATRMDAPIGCPIQCQIFFDLSMASSITLTLLCAIVTRQIVDCDLTLLVSRCATVDIISRPHCTCVIGVHSLYRMIELVSIQHIIILSKELTLCRFSFLIIGVPSLWFEIKREPLAPTWLIKDIWLLFWAAT